MKKRLNAVGSQLKHLSSVPGVVINHLSMDPQAFGLLVAQRFPSRVSLSMLKALGRIPGNPGQRFAALYESAAGQIPRLLERCDEATLLPHSERHAELVASLADTAVATGQPEVAERLLDLLNPHAFRTRISRARLLRWRGELSGALTELGDSERGGKALRNSIKGELEALTSFLPTVAPKSGYVAKSDTVLFYLTNSLPHTYSGYTYRSHAIMRAVSGRCYHAEAVTRFGYPASVGRFNASKTEKVEGITYHRLIGSGGTGDLTKALQRSAEMLSEVVSRVQPSLLHTTTHYENALVVKAVAEAYKIPWVYEVRGQLADTWAASRGEWAYDSERYRLFRQREAELAAEADAVVTLGEGMRQTLINEGVQANRIRLTPNAVGEQYLEEPMTTLAARNQLGLNPDKTLVGTVSSIVDYEGLDDLLRALPILRRTQQNTEIMIAGQGAALEKLRGISVELGIEPYVHLVGRVPKELAPVYQAALDVFVVPRKDASVTRTVTPLKSIEASALGKPVVASDLPALAEVVLNNETGKLVPAENPAALASALDELLGDPTLMKQLGRRGREWALANRTWQANAQVYDEIYRALGALPQ